jgi:O-antigen/teichoic acid export membrane protein
MVSVVNSLVIFCGLPLVYYLGFDGLLWRAIAAAAFSYLGCLAMDGFLFRVRRNWSETLGLLRIGLPIMILSYGIVAFSSMDRLLILLFLDEQAMGEYAICFAVATIVALLPGLIGQFFYPRMTESFAVSGITRRLVKICGQASLLSAVVAGCICTLCYFMIPIAVERFFPKYAPGLPALGVAIIAYFLLAFGAGPNHFLISTFQKRRQLSVLAASVLTMVTAGLILSDLGLVGIAWSLVVGVAVNVGGLWALVLFSLKRSKAS